MSSRKETLRQVIIRSGNKTDIWEKNRPGGVTTKEGHRTHYHNSGNVTNHYGRIISNTRKY
jgi:hypothetical protein